MIQNQFEILNSKLTSIEALLLDFKHEPVKTKQAHQSIDDLDLLTPTETAQLLRISMPTLWRWEKKGELKCYGIGGKRFYKRNEIINHLNKSIKS